MTKPSKEVGQRDAIEITEAMRFVSRGGEKLEIFLEKFSINIEGKTVLDLDASTGVQMVHEDPDEIFDAATRQKTRVSQDVYSSLS